MQMKNIEPKEVRMACPMDETDFPGLAYLCPLNKLIVARKCDTLHHLFGENIDGYTIYNGQGQKVFLAVQQKIENRMEVKIFNFYGNEVIHLKKPHAYCVNRILIWAPPGNFVGSVKKRKCFRNVYVKDDAGETFVKIKPRGILCCIYDIMCEGESIGRVVKRKCAKDLENNEIKVIFPIEMSVIRKSILLGACFLIRY